MRVEYLWISCLPCTSVVTCQLPLLVLSTGCGCVENVVGRGMDPAGGHHNDSPVRGRVAFRGSGDHHGGEGVAWRCSSNGYYKAS